MSKTEEQKKKDREAHRAKYAREHHIGERRVCVVCGQEFISKSEKTQTCSAKCSSILSRRRTGFCNGYLITKTCVVCGKQFETYKSRKITCSAECSDVSKRNKDGERSKDRYCRLKDKVTILKNEPPDGFEFIASRRNGRRFLVDLKCEGCGDIISVDAGTNNENIKCPACEKRKQEDALMRLDIRRRRKVQSKAMRIGYVEVFPGATIDYCEEHVCERCGKAYMARHETQRYCSDRCKRAHHNNNHGKVVRRFTADKYIDKDIELIKLVRRDGGICKLCGMPVDYNDYEWKGGAFIVGSNYPSIDHVIPRAKGGAHSWDNVQLAHHRCNTLKRDNAPEEMH